MGFIDITKKLLRTSSEELQQRYETPEAVLDRYVSELTNNLESARAAIKILRLEEDRLNGRVTELKADEKMWARKARTALKELNDEEVAREALRRKVRARSEYTELERIIETHTRDASTMEKSLEPLESKLQDAINKRERLRARRMSGEARAGVKEKLDDSGVGDFNEVEEQLLEMDAEAQTLSELKLLSIKDTLPSSHMADSEIDRELELLRKEVESSDKKGDKS